RGHAGRDQAQRRRAGSLPRRREQWSALMALLEAQGLNSYYGDSHILFDVSLRVEKSEVVALLGRNGAGKSTTLKSLKGVVAPRSGELRLDGENLSGLPPHRLARAASQRVPDDRRTCASLTA